MRLENDQALAHQMDVHLDGMSCGSVLDPFCGSGSTIAACQAIGYNSIGIEFDDIYFSSLESNIAALANLYPHYRGDILEIPDDGEKPKLQNKLAFQRDMFHKKLYF